MKKLNYLFLSALLLIGHSAFTDENAPIYTLKIKHKSMDVFSHHKPMEGPNSYISKQLIPNQKPELLWIVGHEIKPTGKVFNPDPYVCHDYVYFGHKEYDMTNKARNKHRKRTPQYYTSETYLFVLGHGYKKAHFPDGFGIPIYSDEPLMFETSVSAIDDTPGPTTLSVEAEISFKKARELKKPYHALFRHDLQTFKMSPHFPTGHKQHKMRSNKSDVDRLALAPKWRNDWGWNKYNDGGRPKLKDEKMVPINHWIVPPGRDIAHSRTRGFPIDTTVHFVGAHVHSFAESMELFDVTANKSVWKSTMSMDPRKGNEKVNLYSSKKGFKVYKNHKYDLIAVYNNPTDKPVDAMAMAQFYLKSPKKFSYERKTLANKKTKLRHVH